MKVAAGFAGDDLVAAGAARAGLGAAGRARGRGKGFACAIKPLGLHPFANLAVALRASLLVIRMQVICGRAGTPIAAKGFEEMLAFFVQIVAYSGCFFRYCHLLQTHKMQVFIG